MKRNKKLVSIALAVLMLCAVMAVPSIAQTSVSGPSEVSFTKYMIVDAATNIPGETFTFKVIPGNAVASSAPDSGSVATIDTTGGVTPGDLPTTDTATVSFIAGETATAGPYGTIVSTTQKYVARSATFDFSTVTYTKPGVYRYTIFEEWPGTLNPDVTYADNSYSVDIVVGYADSDDEDDGTMSVLGTYVYKNTDVGGDNNGTATNCANDTPTGSKVNAADVTFPNTMQSNNLTISKKVSGKLGDQEKYFDFTVNVDGVASLTYNFYLYENGTLLNPAVTADAATISAILSGTTIAPFNATAPVGITTQTDTTIHLKHNQKIEILGIPATTAYTVQEETVAGDGYVASIASSSTGTTNGDDGTDGAKVTNTIVDGGNTEAFTNTKNALALTGVVLQVLPFMLIVLIAGAGLAALAISKRRKSHTGR